MKRLIEHLPHPQVPERDVTVAGPMLNFVAAISGKFGFCRIYLRNLSHLFAEKIR